MTPPADGTFPDREAAELAYRVDAAAQAAYSDYLRLVDAGVAPRDAIAQVMASFDTAYYTAFSAAFSAALAEPWTVREVKAYMVGNLPLSAHLYHQHRQTAEIVAGIIRDHAKGLHQARQLALQLYEGYGLRNGEVLRVATANWRTLPKPLRAMARDAGVRSVIAQASARASAMSLKSAALRAAYLQAFDAEMAGASKAQLQALLRVAIEEKSRYFANRIAQSELARTFSDRIAGELMADATIDVVQWRLSGAHSVTDICDMFASVDRYGLGPGCYPKGRAPKPIAHPFCRCRLRSRPDLSAADAQERAAAERVYLKAMKPNEAARLLGSKDRLRRVLAGRPALDVWNTGVADAYRVKRLSELPIASGGKRRAG